MCTIAIARRDLCNDVVRYFVVRLLPMPGYPILPLSADSCYTYCAGFQVLGGAGPAIAAIPASILWAGFSLVDLTSDVASQRLNALQLLPRMGYVAFTAMGQILSVIPRAVTAFLAVLPPRISADTAQLGDPEALRRLTVR